MSWHSQPRSGLQETVKQLSTPQKVARLCVKGGQEIIYFIFNGESVWNKCFTANKQGAWQLALWAAGSTWAHLTGSCCRHTWHGFS